MRLAFFLLVFANLAFFVWSAGYLGEHRSGREPERLSQQLDPNRIRISPPGPGGARITPPQTADTEVSIRICRIIQGLAEGDFASLTHELGLIPSLTVIPKAVEQVESHVVIIPNLPGRQAAEKKMTELGHLGITEAQVFSANQSGPLAIVLGEYPALEAAQERLAAVGKRGVRSARIESRSRDQGAIKLVIEGAPASLELVPGALAKYAAATVANCDPVAQ